jgi:oligosaccharide repeat unit polymerase
MNKLYKAHKMWGRILDQFICFGLMIILLAITLFSWNSSNFLLERYIYFYCWVGVGIIIFALFSWKRLTGKLFTPYTIFFIIMGIFNYGQFIMWAFGIHYKGELGTTNFIRYMDNLTLLRIQMIVCVDFLAFHFGALLMANKVKSNKYSNKVKYDKELFYISMRKVSLIIGIIATIAIFYNSIHNLRIASQYGYTAIYYGSDTYLNPIIKYISYMFFPSLLGTWIGFKYSKKAFYTICVVFIPYLLINLLAGDRGSWIYYILILCWCYLNYIKKPKVTTVIKMLIIGLVLVMSTSVLVKFREVGYSSITAKDITDVVNDAAFVFIKPFFEMGQSARVLGIIIQDNLDQYWSFGNTYIAAFLSMILPRVKTWFGYPDFYLDNWMSQSYLQLTNYGVGFSITAEAYLNGGLLFSPIIMFFIGLFFCRLFYLDHEDLNNPRKLFIVLSSLSSLVFIARGSFELYLRIWFFGTVVMLLIVEFVKSLISNRKI